jgi:hypothetical protein
MVITIPKTVDSFIFHRDLIVCAELRDFPIFPNSVIHFGSVVDPKHFIRIPIRLFKELRIRLFKSNGSGFGSDPNYLLFLQNYWYGF